MSFLQLPLLTVVLCSLCVSVHTGTVYMNGFTTQYGLTGCLNNPTQGCGRGGDTCYFDRGDNYAITGSSPICNACMPKNYRNIATYAYPANLPCAIWRYYQCDNLFVNHIWYKSGSNSCWLSGAKSFNIENTFSSAQAAENRFIAQCRQERSLAYYGLPANTRLITEEKFCFPLRNNITDIIISREGRAVTKLTGYKEYYDNKFNVTVRED